MRHLQTRTCIDPVSPTGTQHPTKDDPGGCDPGASATDTDTATFMALRPRLFGLAYRMLGTRADADDVLQEAWLRWHRTDRGALQSGEAWLVTVVTRLSIDRLRAVKVEREAYVGFWLPEPLVAVDEQGPESVVELADDLSMALLRVLEQLSPEERAAFLLRQVFDHDYADIAALLGKTEAACRQLVHRAGLRVRQPRDSLPPAYTVPRQRHRALLQRFMLAAQKGDRASLQALLADDVALMGDGGGRVASVRHVLRGAFRVTNLYWAVALRCGDQVRYRQVLVNGEPGLLRYVGGQLESAQAFVVQDERIVAVYVVRNPDKLARIALQGGDGAPLVTA